MPNTERADGRKPGALRPVTFEADFAPHATGSVLVRYGSTQVTHSFAMYSSRAPR